MADTDFVKNFRRSQAFHLEKLVHSQEVSVFLHEAIEKHHPGSADSTLPKEELVAIKKRSVKLHKLAGTDARQFYPAIAASLLQRVEAKREDVERCKELLDNIEIYGGEVVERQFDYDCAVDEIAAIEKVVEQLVKEAS